MTADLTIPLLASLIVFLLLERSWALREQRKQHVATMADMAERYGDTIRQLITTHSETCDRLQARSLSEVKSWQAPAASEVKAEEFDADWDRPSFRMPEGTTG